MADIYGKNTEFGKTSILTADVMSIIVEGGLGKDATGFLIQNVTVQYNQPLNRIYEIGSNKVYFAPGRSIGSMQLGRIIGQNTISKVLGPTGTKLWTTQDITAGDRHITLKGTSTFGGGCAVTVEYKISGAVVESYGFAADANGLLVQENVTIQFASLNFK